MPEVTYAQLHSALASLGLTIHETTVDDKRLRVDEHESGVRLPLAYRPDTDPVFPHHLGAIHGSLQVYGIADQWDFMARVLKAG